MNGKKRHRIEVDADPPEKTAASQSKATGPAGKASRLRHQILIGESQPPGSPLARKDDPTDSIRGKLSKWFARLGFTAKLAISVTAATALAITIYTFALGGEDNEDSEFQELVKSSIPRIMEGFPLLQQASDLRPDDTFGCAPGDADADPSSRGTVISCGFKSRIVEGDWFNYVVTNNGEVGRIDGGGEIPYPPRDADDAAYRLKTYADSEHTISTSCYVRNEGLHLYECTHYLSAGGSVRQGIMWLDNGTIGSMHMEF